MQTAAAAGNRDRRGLLIIAEILLWFVSKFIHMPIWVTVIALGAMLLVLIGDIIEYVFWGVRSGKTRRWTGQQ